MPELQIFVLALVQGIAEFLPISSSGHLRLIPFVTGWSDQGLMLDVAVHVGTLAAVVIYFRRDVWGMVQGFLGLVKGQRDEGTRLAGYVIVASLPVVVVGGILFWIGPEALRTPRTVAWATVVFGVVLYGADKYGKLSRRFEQMTLFGALAIGLAQVIALIPGASRSGVTITAARALGFDREGATRFSMLLSIPAILGAATLEGVELVQADDIQLTTDAALAAALAFVSAWAALRLLMRWLQTSNFTPFVIYRIVLGMVLIVWVSG